MEEAELIGAGQRGDVTAFNHLVIIYQELVYNVCLRTLHDADDAADVTQDAFISAFQALKGYRGGSFKAWLMRIATNGCYDLLRKRKRRPSTALDERFVDEDSPTALSDDGPEPEDRALQHELLAYLEHGLKTLPLDQRIVVVLSDVHGLSYEEIAQATSTSIGTVKSRLSRGRGHLRDFMLQHRELLPHHLRHDSVR